MSPGWFAAHVYDLELVANRREIRSVFMQEVDQDKIVLTGRVVATTRGSLQNVYVR